MGFELETLRIGSQIWLVVATLAALLWVSFTRSQVAGYWFFGAGLVTATDGLVQSFPAPPGWLLLLTGDAIVPLGAYLFYRGVAAYNEKTIERWPGLLTIYTTVGWAFALGLDSHLSLYIVMLCQIPVTSYSIYLLWQTQGGMLSRLISYACLPIILFVLAAPWIRGSTDAFSGRATEIQVWNAALVPIVLVIIYALLERDIVRTQRELETSNERLRIAASQAGLGTWTFSPNTREIEVSRAIWDLYGFKPARPLQAIDFESLLNDTAEYNRISVLIRNSIAQGGPFDFETRIKLPDGGVRILNCRGHVLDSGDANFRIIGSTLDVTEERLAFEELRNYRNHLEEVVRQRTEELERSREQLFASERLASLGTLTAGLAHQVNNPIGAIQAAADFARRCQGDEDEIAILRQAVADVEEEAIRCGQIVRGMLQFASAQPTERERVAFDDMISRMLPNLRQTARRYGATIDWAGSIESPVVSLCRLEVEQAITNLVVNAAQSRASGVRITLTLTRRGNNIHLEVRDDGPGIRPEVIGRVLEPFYTSRLQEGGTGLGLSIAHGVAQTHGGDLSITSEVGVGTCARLTFPVAQTSVAEPVPSPSPSFAAPS